MIHKKLGAKMSKFAGYEMPILYKSINYEHENVRKKLGVFDVSHMGEFFIEGPKAYDLLQKICSNDISKLSPGKAQYNYLPNFSGGVVDDLILYQLETERYLMVVNAANIEKDWEWIKNINKNYNADISDKSNSYGLLSVQGPKAIESMQNKGLNIFGPYAADTALLQNNDMDIIVSLYHDQTLPLFKYSYPHLAANVTMGLGIIRTSVDHGIALEQAGRKDANNQSLNFAMDTAKKMSAYHVKNKSN